MAAQWQCIIHVRDEHGISVMCVSLTEKIYLHGFCEWCKTQDLTVEVAEPKYGFH